MVIAASGSGTMASVPGAGGHPMATRDENESRGELMLLWRRRMVYVVLVALAVGAGVWFVRWMNSGLGMDKIGEHYKQADGF